MAKHPASHKQKKLSLVERARAALQPIKRSKKARSGNKNQNKLLKKLRKSNK